VALADVPDTPPKLLVAGSVALDTRYGPFGKVEETLGGSAVYFALAASLIVPVKVVAPVGVDGAKRVAQAFSGRYIDSELLQILEAPTYRWRAHQEHGRNIDLGSRDSIYDTWAPSVPADFEGWAFVGSMRPDRQAQLMGMLGSAKLLAADSMLSYVRARPPEVRDVLGRSGWFFCNREEFAALGGTDPEEFRRQWWLHGLVVKGGALGLAAYIDDGVVRVPALTNRPVLDTTGGSLVEHGWPAQRSAGCACMGRGLRINHHLIDWREGHRKGHAQGIGRARQGGRGMDAPRILIIAGDLVEQDVDAIVNAANNDLVLGAGVAGAIRSRGGPSIQEECDAHGPVKIGEAALTGAGELPARSVIHAASMALGGRTTTDSLRSAMDHAFRLAHENRVKTIAVPAVGTGIAGFPMEECAVEMAASLSKALANGWRPTEVRFVLFGDGARRAFETSFRHAFGG
jgi:O-acetyl-ADP-ribose deacetylase